MLQAIVTLVFVAIMVLAGSLIAAMLVGEWSAIRHALGFDIAPTPQPLPPRYRTLPTRRMPTMTIREVSGLRAAA